MHPEPAPGRSRTARTLVAFGLPLLFFLLAMSIPARGAFEISTDEGINLMKGLLVREGYPLYGEVWSDQPPLFTHLLANAFGLIGTRVENLRLLIALLSALLLFGAFQFIQLVSGFKQAVIGVVLIASLPTYLILSVSIMVGLPSIVFAVLAMTALAYWHRKRALRYLVLSAVLLGAAVMIKLISGLLAPIFLAGLVIAEFAAPEPRAGWRRKLLPAVAWGATFGAVSAAILIALVGVGNIPQLMTNHLGAASTPFFASTGEFRLSAHIGPSYPYLFLAAISGVEAMFRKKWLLMYPFAWMITAYASLYFYTPVWYHHVLLITVPAAILAPDAVAAALDWLPGAIRNVAARWQAADGLHLAALAGLGFFLLVWRTPDPVHYLPFTAAAHSTTPDEQQAAHLLECVAAFSDETSWFLTDRPMYAFRNALLVPPEFAVMSLKRVKTGEITEADLTAGVEMYHPEQILLSRFSFPTLEQSFAGDYTVVAQDDDEERLYVLSSLLAGADRSGCLP